MFKVKPTNVTDVMNALNLFAYYMVNVKIMCTDPDAVTAHNFSFEITGTEERPGDLRLAEVAFQMNFLQDCDDEGILTFTEFKGC